MPVPPNSDIPNHENGRRIARYFCVEMRHACRGFDQATGALPAVVCVSIPVLFWCPCIGKREASIVIAAFAQA
ncbi:hypothetical protein [Ralstonia chuxiongensis]|uniref:hypothetical protein n=1 Tax=Ralstonia chuxiongensis TaxID=2957504 RepID=UPI00292ECE47|nr:hypothetical protein [Ralstonia chuxiongensis]